MKMELSQTLVLHKLAFRARLELDASGRVVYVPNASGTPYIVFDTHRDAPPGFAVKVNVTKKTYIVQCRGGAGGRQSEDRRGTRFPQHRSRPGSCDPDGPGDQGHRREPERSESAAISAPAELDAGQRLRRLRRAPGQARHEARQAIEPARAGCRTKTPDAVARTVRLGVRDGSLGRFLEVTWQRRW